MKQLNAKILKNERVAPNFYRMRIESSYLAKRSKPGQFVEVRCLEGTAPLLRRPLGVHRITENGIEILYEVVGRGTDLLSRKGKGGQVDIIGPLGSGFDIIPSKTAVIVAGGIGVAPLVALAEAIIRHRTSLIVLIGACKKEHILCEPDFKKMGARVLVATEDGSCGKKGFVTDVLEDILRLPVFGAHSPIYACGPSGMLKAVAGIARSGRIPCQVSLEEHMACGVGVCLGCPVKVVSGEYKMVCKDGPVFNAEEIAW